ncbi:type II toxin-antitoxin system RelE/ParE family toxin [Luteolibacter ambystomatis]|uniref:Type II toxin-antitoxin system RelE/ParE family toxin n=1 Tax=Luteolibacter ambystomatis TaxID=2824561 RepID=A0A975G835_9BACT|nr:type II toxin-antitoxin system RelE/ParE family toxin [Luteolibacter ambystomatis]QUE50511.1 type II toxin-antitoxin system RelE/ParE family toxin [Luteolibacter ambystomatis]
MKIRILGTAEEDLEAGYHFYESQAPGIGDYFLDSLFADIDSLHLYAGIHKIIGNKHRMLAKRFPFAIFYRVRNEGVDVWAVLDLRRRPSWIRKQLER